VHDCSNARDVDGTHGTMSNGDPWWLSWILPITTVLGLIGGLLIWIGRVILLPGIKAELESTFEQKHKENRITFEIFEKKFNDAEKERAALRADIVAIREDVAFLRGRRMR
jgi:hypothetical protein